MTKKNILTSAFIFILLMGMVCLTAVLPVGNYAYADDGVFSDETADIGYDLKGYEASITYHSYTLSGSGIFFAFEVTLDKEFLKSLASIDNREYFYQDLLDELEVFFKGLGYKIEKDEYNGQIIAFAEFDTVTEYYASMGRDGFEVYEDNGDVKKGFFFNDYYSKSTTVFSGITDEENVLNMVFNKCLQLGATKEKILLVYAYGTPYKTITSDAEEVEYDISGGIYVHRFNMTLATAGREINLVNHSPNAWAFYTIAVVVALVIIIVPMTIAIKKKKKGE